MAEVKRGFTAGVWGILAMVGITFIIRRFVETTAPNPVFHYERVVERAHGIVAGGTSPLSEDRRIRLGESAHLAFGGFWGVVFALLTRNRELHPVTDGMKYGTTIWLLAFAGYMPALRISKPLWKMGAYRIARTWVTHATFSITTFIVLKAWRSSPG